VRHICGSRIQCRSWGDIEVQVWNRFNTTDMAPNHLEETVAGEMCCGAWRAAVRCFVNVLNEGQTGDPFHKCNRAVLWLE